MNHRQLAVFGEVRVRVDVARFAVCRPAGVTEPERSGQRLACERVRQNAELTRFFHYAERAAVFKIARLRTALFG